MTYAEMSELAESRALVNKVASAVAVQQNVIRSELGSVPNHANRLLWCKVNPRVAAEQMMWILLAQNVGATLAQVNAATDASLLANVASIVDIFATGS